MIQITQSPTGVSSIVELSHGDWKARVRASKAEATAANYAGTEEFEIVAADVPAPEIELLDEPVGREPEPPAVNKLAPEPPPFDGVGYLSEEETG